MLVRKQTFEIPEFLLECGRSLREVQIGFETYGHLNADASNAILITHYFSGNSHAAGRFHESDAEAGYWDQVIGPGKAIDTEKWFIISSDTLCNLNPKLSHVVTTGPASISPETGRPYGSQFPIVTIGDFVRVQKQLCESLGIKRLHAVAGPSMGALQALEWSARFPDLVSRVIAAIPAGVAAEPYLISLIDQWCAPILLDPDFNGGEYYGQAEPIAGLSKSLELITHGARHAGWAQRLFERRWVADDRNPLHALENRFAVSEALETLARDRAKTADANSLLRLGRAVQLFSIRERLKDVRARFLFLPAESDLMLLPVYAERGDAELRAQGLRVEQFAIPGDGGHLDGVYEIGRAAEVIRRFLDSD